MCMYLLEPVLPSSKFSHWDTMLNMAGSSAVVVT